MKSIRYCIIAICLHQAAGSPAFCDTLTFPIRPVGHGGPGPADFFFDPSLGTLAAMWLEYDYTAFTGYSCFEVRLPGCSVAARVLWADTTTLWVWNDDPALNRSFTFDWEIRGSGSATGGGMLDVNGSSRTRHITYFGSGIPDFFIARPGDSDVLVQLTEGLFPTVLPQYFWDSCGQVFVVDFSSLTANELRVTYLYNTPEPPAFVLLMTGVLCLIGAAKLRWP